VVDSIPRRNQYVTSDLVFFVFLNVLSLVGVKGASLLESSRCIEPTFFRGISKVPVGKTGTFVRFPTCTYCLFCSSERPPRQRLRGGHDTLGTTVDHPSGLGFHLKSPAKEWEGCSSIAPQGAIMALKDVIVASSGKPELSFFLQHPSRTYLRHLGSPPTEQSLLDCGSATMVPHCRPVQIHRSPTRPSSSPPIAHHPQLPHNFVIGTSYSLTPTTTVSPKELPMTVKESAIVVESSL
jgi:hypothetical protein